MHLITASKSSLDSYDSPLFHKRRCAQTNIHIKPQGLFLLRDATRGLVSLCREAVTDTLHPGAAELLCLLPLGYNFTFQ